MNAQESEVILGYMLIMVNIYLFYGARKYWIESLKYLGALFFLSLRGDVAQDIEEHSLKNKTHRTSRY